MSSRTLVHQDNLVQKERSTTKYQDAESREYLRDIRSAYDYWHRENTMLRGPFRTQTPNDEEVIRERTRLFNEYKDFLDQQHFAEKFDSRSNLHSSALEQFLYYLFRDLVMEFGSHALIGKSSTFKDIFFAPPSFGSMISRPYAYIEKKDHDFVIGATVRAEFVIEEPGEAPGEEGIDEGFVGLAEDQAAYGEVADFGDDEGHTFDIPSVAIECKTYLDKTMLEASSKAVDELSARFPEGIYIIVAEWLKLSENVNLRKFKVDQIYVLRRQKNTDREYRYSETYEKRPIDSAVVFHLFERVRKHLGERERTGLSGRLERGWLLDSV